MNKILKEIDVNQLFRDAQEQNQCIESFSVDWVEKKDLINTTHPHMQIPTFALGTVLVPVIKIKYFDNDRD